MMESIFLKNIMTKNPITLNIDESFCRVAQIFKEKDIRHLPIVNTQGQILGIISQRDLNRIASPQKSPDGSYLYDPSELAKYMLKQHIIHQVVALGPEDTLEKAVEIMAQKKLGCMPVVNADKQVIGIVTIPDILFLFLKSLRMKK